MSCDDNNLPDWFWGKKDIEDSISVVELLKILENYPKEMKVCLTWESTKRALLAENIYKSKWDCLFIDADYNHYKSEFEQKD